jgi:hypothetical protein
VTLTRASRILFYLFPIFCFFNACFLFCWIRDTPQHAWNTSVRRYIAYVLARSLHLIHILFPMARRWKSVGAYQRHRRSGREGLYIIFRFPSLSSTGSNIPLPTFIYKKNIVKRTIQLTIFHFPSSYSWFFPHQPSRLPFHKLLAHPVYAFHTYRATFLVDLHSSLGPSEQGPRQPQPTARSEISALASTSASHVPT